MTIRSQSTSGGTVNLTNCWQPSLNLSYCSSCSFIELKITNNMTNYYEYFMFHPKQLALRMSKTWYGSMKSQIMKTCLVWGTTSLEGMHAFLRMPLSSSACTAYNKERIPEIATPSSLCDFNTKFWVLGYSQKLLAICFLEKIVWEHMQW